MKEGKQQIDVEARAAYIIWRAFSLISVRSDIQLQPSFHGPNTRYNATGLLFTLDKEHSMHSDGTDKLKSRAARTKQQATPESQYPGRHKHGSYTPGFGAI